MLGGVAPILIFYFPLEIPNPLFNALSGIPLIGDLVPTTIGIPIPLYLDEKLTGLYVEDESKAIDIDTNVQPRMDGKKPEVSQRGVNSLVTINMFASKDSIILAALLALNDLIFSKVVSRKYSVSYLNGSTLVLGGLLHGFSTSSGSNDDLIRIVLQLSKANQEGTSPTNVTSVLPKITGATPVATGG